MSFSIPVPRPFSNNLFISILRPVSYPALDGIRFYAALIVVMEHLISELALGYFRVPESQFDYLADDPINRFWFYWADGNHGVDIFFLISGFLMARIVFGDPAFNYFKFVRNRFLRIYPAFLLSLAASATVLCLLLEWPWDPIEFLKNLIFLNALPGWVRLPYNHVTRSLGFEFAFYLIVPGLLILRPFLGRGLAACAFFAIGLWLIPDSFIRMNGLFLGAIWGAMDDEHLTRLARLMPLWIIAGLYVGIGLCKAEFNLPLRQFYFPFMFSAAFFMIKIVWDDHCLLNRVFGSNAFRWLGTISYSIYLFHTLAISLALTYARSFPPSVPNMLVIVIVAVTLIILFAFSVYVLVEGPYFRRRTAHG